jgi:hypothetical protein
MLRASIVRPGAAGKIGSKWQLFRMGMGEAVTRERAFYAGIMAGLLLIEILIAAFVHDRFVRPHLGDTLAVILAYAGFRAVFGLRAMPAMIAAALLAVAIEFGQLWGLLRVLGLSGNRIARIVLGSGFDPVDFVAYGAGILCIAIFEGWRSAHHAR